MKIETIKCDHCQRSVQLDPAPAGIPPTANWITIKGYRCAADLCSKDCAIGWIESHYHSNPSAFRLESPTK